MRLYALSDEDAGALAAAASLIYMERKEMGDYPDCERFWNAFRRIHYLREEHHFPPDGEVAKKIAIHKADIERLKKE